jgi:signal transduction histidine kinase
MRRRSLRYDITLTLLLFVSVSSGLFALAMDHVNDRMERSLLKETLEHEFEEFRDHYQESRRLPLPYSSHMRSYLVDAGERASLPAPLRRLAPGDYHEVRIDGREYHVLHRVLDGKLLYIAHDITRNERREDRFRLFLILGVLVASGLAVWVGSLLSRRLVAPVTTLAARVSHLEPGGSHARLTGEFVGAEVEVIAQAFDRFLQRLESFLEREQAFTEDASHELRTPLAVIDSASELLLADPRLAENLRQPLRRIQRASRQMTRLTRALLFLARESGGQAETGGNECQADRVVAELVEAHAQLSAGRPVALQFEAPEPLRLPVAPEFLEIVVANLLRNALAHTVQGHVRITLLRDRLTVADTGSGIAAADLPRIFERHYRGTGSQGLGRGLDLVKRICERLGWRIEVASAPGQGTSFTLLFRG